MGAVSIVEAIATPGNRGRGYQRLAAALPATERDRKRTLLERATRRAHGGVEGADDILGRVNVLGEIADGWLNLGEVEKGRELLLEAFKLLEAISPPHRSLNRMFLATAARIDLESVDIPHQGLRQDRLIADSRPRRSCQIPPANEHPAEAERVFRLYENEASDPRFASQKTMLVLHLCHRMAKVDPERAKRIRPVRMHPAEKACAWALLAIGLTDRDKPAARSALNESIQIIDRLLDAARASERLLKRSLTTNPTALILPIVEKVAPERVEEFFWRAVALVESRIPTVSAWVSPIRTPP